MHFRKENLKLQKNSLVYLLQYSQILKIYNFYFIFLNTKITKNIFNFEKLLEIQIHFKSLEINSTTNLQK